MERVLACKNCNDCSHWEIINRLKANGGFAFRHETILKCKSCAFEVKDVSVYLNGPDELDKPKIIDRN